MTDTEHRDGDEGFFEELDPVVFGVGFAIAIAAVVAFVVAPSTATEYQYFTKQLDDAERLVRAAAKW